MQHESPGPDYGTRLPELRYGNILPDDVMDNPEEYQADPETTKAIRAADGKPDVLVTIYRAQPDVLSHIRTGDWVTLSRYYADDHGYNPVAGHMPVYRARVEAAHLWTVDSLAEWGYWGPDVPADNIGRLPDE